MKKRMALICIMLLLVFASACTADQTNKPVRMSRQDYVLASMGAYESKQFWTHGFFQDYTDFGMYTFASANLEDSPYFSVVTEEDMVTIDGFITNFEGWIDVFKTNDPADELVLNYSFDRSIVDTSDYFYIYEGEFSEIVYSCYDLWIYDTQTHVLYYFHNNI